MMRSFLRLVLLAATASCLWGFFPTGTQAQEFSRHEMIEGLARPGGIPLGALSPGPAKTLGLQPISPSSQDAILSQKSDRDALSRAIAAYDPPRVDVEILFRFGSDEIDPAAYADIGEVAQALLSPELADTSILIAGHTDAVGSAAYNLDLSLRRAIAVRRHIVNTYGVAQHRLLVTGFGFERLKDFLDTDSPRNRRVEFINITGLTQ
jgi:outer membrane protein OmpA-like peptidoglycan-associated protein